MEELEYFYKNHYKTNQMVDWSELTDYQKTLLEKSIEYHSFKLNKALENFKDVICKDIEKLIKIVNSFTK